MPQFLTNTSTSETTEILKFLSDHRTPDCLPLSRLTQIFLLKIPEMTIEERRHLGGNCDRCRILSKALSDNPWHFKAWLCEMYDELYQVNDQAYQETKRV